MSWNSGTKSALTAAQWKGPFAARPVDYDDNSIPKAAKTATSNATPYAVDYVVLDEVTEVVKYESMNIIDSLLLVDSQQKIDQRNKIKKHKHVVFAEDTKPGTITEITEVREIQVGNNVPILNKPKGMRFAEMPVNFSEEEEEPEPVKEDTPEESSSDEEIEYVKESVVGICDFNFC